MAPERSGHGCLLTFIVFLWSSVGGRTESSSPGSSSQILGMRLERSVKAASTTEDGLIQVTEESSILLRFYGVHLSPDAPSHIRFMEYVDTEDSDALNRTCEDFTKDLSISTYMNVSNRGTSGLVSVYVKPLRKSEREKTYSLCVRQSLGDKWLQLGEMMGDC